jgi:hypothetical protein
LEHGKIIRDLPNTEGSANAELQAYFSADVDVTEEEKEEKTTE